MSARRSVEATSSHELLASVMFEPCGALADTVVVHRVDQSRTCPDSSLSRLCRLRVGSSAGSGDDRPGNFPVIDELSEMDGMAADALPRRDLLFFVPLAAAHS